jgi:hypothetical protein
MQKKDYDLIKIDSRGTLDSTGHTIIFHLQIPHIVSRSKVFNTGIDFTVTLYVFA